MVSLNDFSVMVEGMQRNNVEKGLNTLFPHLLSAVGPDFKRSLIAFTVPEVREEVEQREDRRDLY